MTIPDDKHWERSSDQTPGPETSPWLRRRPPPAAWVWRRLMGRWALTRWWEYLESTPSPQKWWAFWRARGQEGTQPFYDPALLVDPCCPGHQGSRATMEAEISRLYPSFLFLELLQFRHKITCYFSHDLRFWILVELIKNLREFLVFWAPLKELNLRFLCYSIFSQ